MTAVTLLPGCQGSAPPDPSAPTTETATAAPGADGPDNDEERAISREAVRRLDDFEAENQLLLAAGKATRQAKEFYQDTLREWEPSYERLQSNEREGIVVARRPVVLSTDVVSIESFQDNAAEVVLRRCTDQSDLGVTRAGVPVPAVHEAPVIQEVAVYRYENLTWRIGTISNTDTPCAR